jgi:hypothetical protein
MTPRRPSPQPSPGVPDEGAVTRRSRRALGLIELLTLVAVLMIALALMVGTARHVRSASANELTRKRMLALADAAGEAISRGVDPTLPTSEIPATDAEARFQQFALRSSLRLEAALNDRGTAAAKPAMTPGLATAIVAATVGRPELDDAWGRPIALMPRQEPSIGMAPDDGPFLVSAGPDGRFLTLSDNIYSYDLPVLLPPVADRGQQPGVREDAKIGNPRRTQ